MNKLYTYVFRGKIIESFHESKSIVKDFNFKTIFSSSDNNNLIYPRSSIKIFQAMPLVLSNAHVIYNLNDKNLAIACASHTGEKFHLEILKKWLTKININKKILQCGIHNPINLSSSNKLLLSGCVPDQLHNNCAGKHLGMISGCLAKKISIKNYIDPEHPYQKLIAKILVEFMGYNINKKNIGIDGCNVPQYAFPLEKLADSMINLMIVKEKNNEYSKTINTLLNSIQKNPYIIGGTNRFDSDVIKITKGRIFCKGGAEGVLLFADLKKRIGGVIKVIDGNYRVIPSIAIKLFRKLSILNNFEYSKLSNWNIQILYNYRKKNIGRIQSEVKLND